MLPKSLAFTHFKNLIGILQSLLAIKIFNFYYSLHLSTYVRISNAKQKQPGAVKKGRGQAK